HAEPPQMLFRSRSRRGSARSNGVTKSWPRIGERRHDRRSLGLSRPAFLSRVSSATAKAEHINCFAKTKANIFAEAGAEDEKTYLWNDHFCGSSVRGPIAFRVDNLYAESGCTNRIRSGRSHACSKNARDIHHA